MHLSTHIIMQPMQWAATKDIHDIAPLSERDAEVLHAVREVLRTHGALHRFGIMLVHKHFDLDNEKLVEFTDCTNRRLTIQPVPAASCIPTIETAWRFAEEPGDHDPTICLFECAYDPYPVPQHLWNPVDAAGAMTVMAHPA